MFLFHKDYIQPMFICSILERLEELDGEPTQKAQEKSVGKRHSRSQRSDETPATVAKGHSRSRTREESTDTDASVVSVPKGKGKGKKTPVRKQSPHKRSQEESDEADAPRKGVKRTSRHPGKDSTSGYVTVRMTVDAYHLMKDET